MSPVLNKTIFGIFIISGFCSLLYQIIWMRLALSFFGVITPIVSVVVSSFMLGLSVGTWLGGKFVKQYNFQTQAVFVLIYGVIECIIGIGAFIVPKLFAIGNSMILSNEMNSFEYLLFSSILISVSLIPWCLFMGLTFPVIMFFIKQVDPNETTGFSFLYLANVIGAMLGTFISGFIFIELFGFKNSLALAGFGNFFICFVCLCIFIKMRNFKASKVPLSKSYSVGKESLKGNIILV